MDTYQKGLNGKDFEALPGERHNTALHDLRHMSVKQPLENYVLSAMSHFSLYREVLFNVFLILCLKNKPGRANRCIRNNSVFDQNVFLSFTLFIGVFRRFA